ncbi:putative siderochrome-iron transporter [Aspergillus indologenus CBS 114.80]|uniref:Putative siderochrome-iron transporter n=1 Tax=Aspergillus indologenus CBS 114.80 TaxID=1450541 RepID=A0A2V5I3B0_9EURO|nr:putative siderochrome-iron transporter [Aspergillus indologenus CBS 114.80]
MASRASLDRIRVHQTSSADQVTTSDPERHDHPTLNDKEAQGQVSETMEDGANGVNKVEAAASVWTKKTLLVIYAWIWVCFFMLAFHSSIGLNVLVYAYANFNTAPEISTAAILATVVGGVMKLPVSKILNDWGRAEALLIFTSLFVLGIIVLASCTGPSGFAAGYVLYWVSYNALYLILDVFMADTSGLRNRAFAFGFSNTPFICTAFTGPLAAQSFLSMTSWRWAYGAFAIIFPCVFLPLAVVFKFHERKAKQLGLYTPRQSNRTWTQSVLHYIHEFDAIGALILMAAFILLLLPFSLTVYGRAQYRSAIFIAMLVMGGGYMNQIYNIGSCCWAPLFGWYIRQTRRFKHACLYGGLPLMILGSGLMVDFRGAHHRIGYVVMCQLFIAVAGGTLVIGQEMAVMAVADHDGVPMMLSVLGLFASLGGAAGNTVGSAVYTNVFPDRLRAALPRAVKGDWADIYLGGYRAQMEYPVGSEVRTAINFAWGESQKYSCIATTAVLVLGFPCILIWKNVSVDQRQNKGVML